MKSNTERMRFLVLGFLFATVFGFVPVARAQSPLPEDQMYRIAKQLNCPTCAGRNLADCPTDTCTQWKNEIIAQLKQGKSADDIVGYFKDRFGSQVLQEPPKEGFLLVMWVVPVLAAVALVVLAGVAVRRASLHKSSPSPVQQTAQGRDGVGAAYASLENNEYTNQLEDDVKCAS